MRAPKVYQVGLELIVVSLVDSETTAPFKSKTSGNYRSGFCVLDLNNIPAGVYNIIPSTYVPEQEGPFFLKYKGTTGVGIEKII